MYKNCTAAFHLVLMASEYHLLHYPASLVFIQNRSFSLLFSDRSLDVVCKDKREFDTWTTGIKASLFHIFLLLLLSTLSYVTFSSLDSRYSPSLLPLFFLSYLLFLIHIIQALLDGYSDNAAVKDKMQQLNYTPGEDRLKVQFGTIKDTGELAQKLVDWFLESLLNLQGYLITSASSSEMV